MANRCHYSNSSFTVAGQVVYVVPNSQVTLYEAGTTTPIAATIYAGNSGGTTKTNPFTTDAYGTINFYLALPQYVKVVATGLAPDGSPATLTADFQHVHGDPATISNMLYEKLSTPLATFTGIGTSSHDGIAISTGNGFSGAVTSVIPKPAIVVQKWKEAPMQSAPSVSAWPGAEYLFYWRSGSNVLPATTATHGGTNWIGRTGSTFSNAQVGKQIDIVGGTGAINPSIPFQQSRIVTAFDNGSTPPRLYVDVPWDVQPTAGSIFVVNDGGALASYVGTDHSYDDSTTDYGGLLQISHIGRLIQHSQTGSGASFGLNTVGGNYGKLGKVVGYESDIRIGCGEWAPRFTPSGTGPRQNVNIIGLSQTSDAPGTVVQANRAATGGAGDGTSLVDTGLALATNQYATYYQVHTISGTGAGQYRRIASNTSNAFVPVTPFSPAVDSTTHYEIQTASANAQAFATITAGAYAWYWDGFVFNTDSIESAGAAIQFRYLHNHGGAKTPAIYEIDLGAYVRAYDSGAVARKIMEWEGDRLHHRADDYRVDAAGGTNRATLDANGLTLAGHLFLAASKLMSGDYSTATLANRTAFQTSTANGKTQMTAIPLGSAREASWEAYAHPTAASAAVAAIVRAIATEAQVRSDSPAGTYQDLGFYANNVRAGYFKASDGRFYTTSHIHPSGQTDNAVRAFAKQNKATGGAIAVGTATTYGVLLVTNHTDNQTAIVQLAGGAATAFQGAATTGFSLTSGGAGVRVYWDGSSTYFVQNANGTAKDLSAMFLGVI
jgi:hypothetical protein